MSLEIENLFGTTDHLVQGVAIIPQKDANKYIQPASKVDESPSRLGEIYPSTNVNSKIRYFYGAEHNLPDRFSVNATKIVFDMCKKLARDDILVALISGGGSALLSLPASISHTTQTDYDENNLELKLNMIRLLVQSGATINELNTIRSCLSSVKGGKLALCAHPARVCSLIISDVIDDPLEIIASGPTFLTDQADQTRRALEILEKFKLINKLSANVMDFLRRDQQSVDLTAQNRLG